MCRNSFYPCMTQPQYHAKMFPLLRSASKYISDSTLHDYACDEFIFLPSYALIMQNLFPIMLESACASSTNIQTTEISIKISFQRYMTWLSVKKVKFLPNHALIMQRLILIMHGSDSIPTTNTPTTEISFKIRFQRYMTWLSPHKVHLRPIFGLIMHWLW